MRVVIASRIFAPEPAAAAFRLAALARELVARGHEVEVLTTRFEGARSEHSDGLRVRRAPVMRDRSGAVRGYLPYASFDVPLFWRILAVRRADVYVVEPPPTTGLVVAAVTALLRRPFVYYAADVLADAAASADSPSAVVRAVRWMERTVWRRARTVLSVSPGVTARLRALGAPARTVVEVGNGIDTLAFTGDGDAVQAASPFALYAGTASEVHGAVVFVDAMAQVEGMRLVFLGSGVEIDDLRRRADAVAPGRVEFLPTVEPREVARWLRAATVALASVRPEGGYQFAFPTKLYAAAACGTPLLFSGAGPGSVFARDAPLGRSVPHDADAVADGLRRALENSATSTARREQAEWAAARVSLTVVAQRAARAVEGSVPV
ncbi:MAG: glycosyltransferase family 4 protein [Microcella pacifica]|uniref:glycosyltransferase family 4 protein n=1 Tax=Microcella pacifica TaxID=2591847 RepID=UPI003314DB94